MRRQRWMAKMMILAVLAGTLTGCGSAETGNEGTGQEQSSQTSQETAGEESIGKETEQQEEDKNNSNNASNNTVGTVEQPVIENGTITLGDIQISLEPEDEYTAWDENLAVRILLDDSGVTVEGQGAKADGSTVTIEKGGTYVLRGSLSDGTILVDTGDDDTVRLVFDGVDIHSKTSSPVDIKKVRKAIISLEAGTVNSLSDSPDFVYRNEEKEEPNAALFCKGDLTINGSGTLKVHGTFHNGIGAKDVLKIAGGILEVTAANHGVKGNDGLVIYSGDMKINAVGDGVKSDMLAAVCGGNIVIDDCEEGLEAENVVICGGTIDLTARDDGINASTDTDNTPWIYLMDGEVTVRAEGDGIDSNGSVFMSGGKVTVYGPSGRDNGALDYDREFYLTGGVLAAFGPGGMEQNVSSSDSQVSVLADFEETQKEGTEVVLRDESGKELYRETGEKDFRTLVLSVPEMTVGSEYEIRTGETVISFVPEETIIYVNQDGIVAAAAMGPGRGGPGGRRDEEREGGRGGRVEGQPGEGPEERPKGRPGEGPEERPKGGPGERPEDKPEEKGNSGA